MRRSAHHCNHRSGFWVPARLADPSARPAGPSAEEVRAFLRANPAWLAQNPDLYSLLEPPHRLHGERLADHMAAMLARARAEAVAGAEDRRAAEGFAHRVQEGVLALIRAPDPVAALAELPAHLRLDGVRLCAEIARPGVAWIPPGTVSARLGRRETALGEAHRDPLLHGEAAPLAEWEALVRVNLPGGPALLALACRDGRGLVGATARTLVFLGQAVSAVL